jgi:cytolysin (calcineurin-like family phosphatase)
MVSQRPHGIVHPSARDWVRRQVVFDYNRDGRPDIFFTNGANIATLKQDSPKFSNRLFRNEGGGVFTDVTRQAGLAGTGYDNGVASEHRRVGLCSER